MGDIDRRFVPRNRTEIGVDLIFGYRIKRGCRFVKEDKRRILAECACEGNLLGLPAGEFRPVFVNFFVQLCVYSVRERVDFFTQSGLAHTQLGFFQVCICGTFAGNRFDK